MNTHARLLAPITTLAVGLFIIALAQIGAPTPLGAQTPLGTQATAGSSRAPQVIHMEVFGRGDSDLSLKAKEYAERLGNRTDGLTVVFHDVLKDRDQLSRLWKLARKTGRDKPVVPAFYCCGKMSFGFTSEELNGSSVENLFTVDVYTRSTCSRCQAGKRFIEGTLKPRWPALRFRIYEITYDTAARNRYMQLSQSRGMVPGLPTFHFGGQVIVGYQGDHLTGEQWNSAIRRVSRSASLSTRPSSNKNDTSAIRPMICPVESQLGAGGQVTQLVAFRRPSVLPKNVPDRSHAQDYLLIAFQPPDSPKVGAADFDEVPPPDGAAENAEMMAEGGASFDDVPFPDDLELPEEASGSENSVDTIDDIIVVDDFGDIEESQSDAASDIIELPLFGAISASDIGLPLFTFLVGLVDGFNPCAMWILVFLLSVLVNVKDRRKILLIAGTFVLVSGLAYFAFMAAWLNVFMLIGIARWAQVALGTVALLVGAINIKDFFAFKKGISLSIPESSKPGLYRRVREIVTTKYLTTALAGVVVLAVIVNMVELLCTAGLPALYTQILTMQDLPAWKNYCYLALYISAYMLDDTVLLAIVLVTMSHRRLQEKEGRWLKLISGVAIFALGVVMIFKPTWLQLTH